MKADSNPIKLSIIIFVFLMLCFFDSDDPSASPADYFPLETQIRIISIGTGDIIIIYINAF